MIALAVQKVSGLCPAGTLEELHLRLKSGRPLDQADLTGECDSADLAELSTLLPGVSLRRMPRLAKIALRAALDAADSLSRLGALIINTSYGSVTSTFEFLDSVLQDGSDLASPTAFSHSVTNMTAALVSQGLRLTGPCLTITQPTLTASLEAIAALLTSGQVDRVLWGTVSERSSTMAEVAKRAGCNQLSLTDGAVFFRLALPDPNKKELLLEFDVTHPAASTEPDISIGLAEAAGPGPLALSLRLALTSLFLKNISDRPTARAITDGREMLILSNGGISA